jgi:hypothetical protein
MKLYRFTRRTFINGHIIEAGESALVADNVVPSAQMIDVAAEQARLTKIADDAAAEESAHLAKIAADEARRKAAEAAVQEAQAALAAARVAEANAATTEVADTTGAATTTS